MSEYIIRPSKDRDVFIVSKWNFGDIQPVEIYIVDLSMNRPTCTCASGKYRGWCKHPDMVRKYRKQHEHS